MHDNLNVSGDAKKLTTAEQKDAPAVVVLNQTDAADCNAVVLEVNKEQMPSPDCHNPLEREAAFAKTPPQPRVSTVTLPVSERVHTNAAGLTRPTAEEFEMTLTEKLTILVGHTSKTV